MSSSSSCIWCVDDSLGVSCESKNTRLRRRARNSCSQRTTTSSWEKCGTCLDYRHSESTNGPRTSQAESTAEKGSCSIRTRRSTKSQNEIAIERTKNEPLQHNGCTKRWFFASTGIGVVKVVVVWCALFFQLDGLL